MEEEDSPKRVKKRGKSQAKIDHDETQDYLYIQSRLSSLLIHPPEDDLELQRVIQNVHAVLHKSVFDLSKISLEAHLLINIHVARCLEHGNELPEFNQSFFYSSAALVTDSSAVKNDSLRETYNEFTRQRPDPSSGTDYNVPIRKHYSKMIDNLAKQMKTNAENLIVLNFTKRLIRHIRLKYRLANAHEAECVVYEASTFGPKRQIAQEIVDWLGYEVFPIRLKKIEKNLNFYVHKLDEMLEYQLSLPNRTKFKRTFSLFPLKRGFQMDFVKITRSQLGQVYQMLDEYDRKVIFERVVDKIRLEIDSDEKTEAILMMEKALKNSKYTVDLSLMRNERICTALWRVVFNINPFETVNRKFNYSISTDGYSVSIEMQKPKADPTEKKKPKYQEKSRKKKKQTDDGVEEDGEDFVEKNEYDPLPSSDELDGYNHFVGIDPGVTYLATGYTGEGGKSFKISTKEYRHLSKTTQKNKWEKKLRKREQEYRDKIKDLPSFKTNRVDVLMENTRKLLLVSDWLLKFCRDKPFRKWRFTTSRFSKRAMDTICKRVVPEHARKDVETGDKKTLVGFGDWSQQDGMVKKKPKAPVKKFKKMLRTYATVVRIDEYRTSKTCSYCEHEQDMYKVKHWQKQYVKRLRMKKFGLFPSHEVVRCKNCTKCWQRDNNASRNMYRLLHCLMNGEERPVAMKRKSKKTNGGGSGSSTSVSDTVSRNGRAKRQKTS